MSRFTGTMTRMATVAILIAPMLALAQGAGSTGNSGSALPSTKTEPADQPRSNLEKQQTEQNGQATKYGEKGSAGNTQPSRTDSSSGTSKSQNTSKTSPSGDPSSTSTPTNTASPTKTN